MIKVVAMAPDEVKHTASQFGPGVQIVSPPPDQVSLFELPNNEGRRTASTTCSPGTQPETIPLVSLSRVTDRCASY